MTELQKGELFKLRLQGVGWEYISAQLSVPSSTLKTYCYRNGLSDTDLEGISESN